MNLKLSSFIAFLMFVVTVGAGCTDSSGWDTEEDWSKNQQEDRDREDQEEYSDEEEYTDEDEHKSELGDALNELGDALEELGEAFNKERDVEPVDFRELQEALPDRIRGMEKGTSNGERTGLLGFRISKAEQTYEEKNDEGRLDISIVDLGGLRNLAAAGLDWLKLDVDRESSDGYERTRTYRGHPVLDKCERTSRYDQCEMTAFVSRRFVVKLESRGMEMGSLEDVMEAVDVRKLERMKDDGVDER